MRLKVKPLFAMCWARSARSGVSSARHWRGKTRLAGRAGHKPAQGRWHDGTACASVRTQPCQQLATAFDAQSGGFGAAPKFPHPAELAFLLQRRRDEGDEQARDMALLTLRKMAEGGLFDQIGGGFFRYSVDAQWHIPHFEKMLSDNGVLLALYADALALTGEPLFRRVVDATADWALREMLADAGGFHASLAADDPQAVKGSFTSGNPTRCARCFRLLSGMCAPHTGACWMRPILRGAAGTCTWRALPPAWQPPWINPKCWSKSSSPAHATNC